MKKAAAVSFAMMFWASFALASPPSQAAPVQTAPVQSTARAASAVQIKLDKTSIKDYGTIDITGKAPAGDPVYIEVWSKDKINDSYFDSKPDKEGKRPFIFYTTKQMPAFYRIFAPTNEEKTLQGLESQGKKWSCSLALKDSGAQEAFIKPECMAIKRYHASLLGSLFGSHGQTLPAMSATRDDKWAMNLIKDRSEVLGNLIVPDVKVNANGTFSAKIIVPSGAPAGNYDVRAIAGPGVESRELTFKDRIVLPYLYLAVAGKTVNVIWPFLLALVCTSFAMLWGGGGGAVLNPLIILLWSLPPMVVAGTVLPTVIFSQASGIYNYSKIKFINWRLGICIGLAMLLGAFIGPQLTSLITVSEFKSVFGWLLLFIAVMMLYQTTPWYMTKNKKEQAILQEFRSKAQQAVSETA